MPQPEAGDFYSDYMTHVRVALLHLVLIRKVAQNCFDAVPCPANFESLKEAIRQHERVQAIWDVHQEKK